MARHITSEQVYKELESIKKAKECRELWDKVAAEAIQGLMPIYWETIDQYDSAGQMVKCQVESAFDYADAFMAERAKRMGEA